MFGAGSASANSFSGGFGTPSPFGQSSNPFTPKPFGTPAFGSQNVTPTFGGSSSGFSGTSSIFGQSNSVSNPFTPKPFGTPSNFGSQNVTPTFGASGVSGTSSIFGSAFGHGTTTQAFGPSPIATSGSSTNWGFSSSPAFNGSSSSLAGPFSFGNKSTSGQSLTFGTSPVFGQTTTRFVGNGITGNTGTSIGTQSSISGSFPSGNNSTFGPSSTFGSNIGFGQTSGGFGQTIFGNNMTGNIGSFGSRASGSSGTSSSFGHPSFGPSAFGGQLKGSKKASYSKTTWKDDGGANKDKPVMVSLNSISAMPVFTGESHEELRWEDYQLKGVAFPGISNTYSPTNTSFNPFTSSSSTNVFSPNPSVPSNPPLFSNTPFPANNLSTNTSQAPAFSTFAPNSFPGFSTNSSQAPSSSTSAPISFPGFSTNSSQAPSSSTFAPISFPGFSLNSSQAPSSSTFAPSSSTFAPNSFPGFGLNSTQAPSSSTFAPKSFPGFSPNSMQAPSISSPGTSFFPANSQSSPFPSFTGISSIVPGLNSTSNFAPSPPQAVTNFSGSLTSTPAFPFPSLTSSSPISSFCPSSTSQTTTISPVGPNTSPWPNFQPFKTAETGATTGWNLNSCVNVGLNTSSQQFPFKSNEPVSDPYESNPFGTPPVTSQFSVVTWLPSQHGISTMPIRDEPTLVRISSLITPRRLTHRKNMLPTRKYDPKSQATKVPFFSNGQEKQTVDGEADMLLPRENPRSLIVGPSDNWPRNINSENTTTSNHTHVQVDETDGCGSSKGAVVSTKPCVEPNPVRTIGSITKKSESVLYPLGKEDTNDVELLSRLESSDYYTEPKYLELVAKEREEPGFCSHVKDFVVGRLGYGYIKFTGQTDLRNLDVKAIVQFNHREVIVYMDESKKPPVGEGLNRPAEVTLLNIKYIDKKTGEACADGPRVEKYKEMLMKKAKEQGAEFLSYDPAGGVWKFRVQHF